MEYQKISPGIKIKNYAITKKLGGGNFGQVYLAYDTTKMQDVALKAMSKLFLSKNKKAAQLVQSEYQIMERINCCYVVSFWEYFEDKDFQYIVMEYCDEGDMQSLLSQQKKFCEEESLNYFWQILNGVKVLHENKVIHRDLKLANILKKKGVLKIADLGFAKQLEEENMMTKTILGSLLTMAPEIIEGQQYGLEVVFNNINDLLHYSAFNYQENQ